MSSGSAATSCFTRGHPRDLGPLEVRAFLSHFALVDGVAASTQNQAWAALAFLYGAMLQQPLERIRRDPERGDFILCQITSNPYADPFAVELADSDFTEGSLQRVSFARPGKPVHRP